MTLNKIKSDLKNLNILIVDDGEDIINIMNKTFKMIVNQISLAKDGNIAIELYKKNNPDLILTDLRMPDKDGIEFIKEVRKINSKIPIIVITAYEDDLKEEDKQLINTIFPKPINFITLVNKINEFL